MKAIFFILFFGSTLIQAAEATGPMGKKIGVGLMLFGPSGISANYFLNSGNSIDAALAWNTGAGQTIYLHSDFLINRPDFFRIESVKFDFYYGIGGKLVNKDSSQANFGVNLGVRVPVGLSYNWESVPIHAFGEIGAGLNLIPGTNFEFIFALGGRYFF